MVEEKKEPYKLPRTVTRREFIVKSGLFAGGVVATLSGFTALGVYGAKKNKRIKKNPDQLATLIELGPADQFKQSNDVSSVKFETEIQDAWVTRKVNGTVFVTKDDNGNLLIMSPVCTHLGCNVNLTSESEKKTNPELTFYCPCHGGEYNQQGINIGGPPPRPLDIYQPIVQNDKLFINYFEQIQRKKR